MEPFLKKGFRSVPGNILDGKEQSSEKFRFVPLAGRCS